jgi:hypothetical protein
VWRKSYEQMVDYVATHVELALALGFSQRTPEGQLRTISKGQYWERRAALGLLPFVFFFLGLVGQLIAPGRNYRFCPDRGLDPAVGLVSR